MPADESLPEPTPVERMRVWVMCWQGKEQMPPIVKACHESLLRHARGLEVVLITRDNVSDYVKLPETIRRKLDEGRILLPALSDYVRASLLSNYGGIWVDSTMFFVRDIPNAAINNVFFTNHIIGYSAPEVTKGRWNGVLGDHRDPLPNIRKDAKNVGTLLGTLQLKHRVLHD